MIKTVARYFQTGPMTQDKREWIQKQIDGLVQANIYLKNRIDGDTVNLSVNQRQIESLTKILRSISGDAKSR